MFVVSVGLQICMSSTWLLSKRKKKKERDRERERKNDRGRERERERRSKNKSTDNLNLPQLHLLRVEWFVGHPGGS